MAKARAAHVEKISSSVLEELWFGENDVAAAEQKAARSAAARFAEKEGVRPFPATTQRLMAELSTPDFDLTEVCAIIERDLSLAACTLRIANSAAQAGLRPCDTVKDAVMRLGSSTIREIAISVGMMASFSELGGVGRTVRDHSASVGAIARVLGWRIDRRLTGLFVCGLLHDVGKLLLLQAGNADYRRIDHAQTAPDQIHLRERELLGYDHAVLGAHMLEKWRFPDEVVRAVAWHHEPGRAYRRRGDIAAMVAMVRIADGLAPADLAGRIAPPEVVAKIAAGEDGLVLGLTARDLAQDWPLYSEAHADSQRFFGG